MSDVQVLEGGRRYRPGGCVELGCSSPAGTFGVTRLDGKTRVVWHYSANDEARTFEIRYALRGVAVAYGDVVDVNLQVWGDEWDEGLGRLTATLTAPGKVVRAWGHPVYVRGDVQLAGNRVLLRALDVPAHQFVELRALIPRSAFTSTAGMRDRSGPGAREDHGRGARATPPRTSATTTASTTRRRIPWLYVVYVLLLGLVPALLVVLLVYVIFGRELSTRLRPRVRAGAAHGHGAGARADAAAAGRRGRVVRVHGDAVRPHPPRRLHREARDDRALDLGRPAHRSRSPTSRSRPATPSRSCGRGSARSPTWSRASSAARPCASPTSATASRPDRTVMSGRFTRFKQDVSAEATKRRWFVSWGLAAADRRARRVRRDRGAALLPRDRRLAVGLPALERRRAARARGRGGRSTRWSSSAR